MCFNSATLVCSRISMRQQTAVNQSENGERTSDVCGYDITTGLASRKHCWKKKHNVCPWEWVVEISNICSNCLIAYLGVILTSKRTFRKATVFFLLSSCRKTWMIQFYCYAPDHLSRLLLAANENSLSFRQRAREIRKLWTATLVFAGLTKPFKEYPISLWLITSHFNRKESEISLAACWLI